MKEDQLKSEFEKHLNSRACEKPSKEMLYEFFVEGYKLGHPGSKDPIKKSVDSKQNKSDQS